MSRGDHPGSPAKNGTPRADSITLGRGTSLERREGSAALIRLLFTVIVWLRRSDSTCMCTHETIRYGT